MFKFRILALVAAGLLALVGGGSALAAHGGDPNAGDVWVDNVGQAAGPGHEMDPHLSCQDINLWGAGLSDGSGAFSIYGWPPSGGKEVDYSGTWSYDGATGGDQVIATISIYNLIEAAQANGDSAAHNGYHFKLEVSQDPHKFKTFWVACSTLPPKPSPPSSTQNGTRRTRATHHRRVRQHRRRRQSRRHRSARRISRPPKTARGFTG